MPQDIDFELRKGMAEVLKDFDLIPKTHDLRKSEYRYRLLMVQMLEKLLEEQKARLKVLELGLTDDRGMDPEPEPATDRLEGFPQEGARIDKVIFFIKREGRPLLLREIAQCLKEVDYEAARQPSAYGAKLSVYLSQGLKRGRVKRYSLPRKRGGWYFPNSWADENGELLDEYRKMID